MAHKPEVHSDYLHSALDLSKKTRQINKICRLANRYDFQAFAFRGMSGALMAPVLAFKSKKSLIMVRKAKSAAASDHSAYRVEGDKNTLRYFIVDDFTSSGETVRKIVSEISEFAPNAKCIGIILYNDFLKYGLKYGKDADITITPAQRHLSPDQIEYADDARKFKIVKTIEAKLP